MEELCSEIERNIDEFKVPPIGPLGKYIKLTRKTGKDENLASLLQNQLGVKLLSSFLVDNRHDREILNKLMDKQNFSKKPRIEEKKRYKIKKKDLFLTRKYHILFYFLIYLFVFIYI